jgi:hypothetical protein
VCHKSDKYPGIFYHEVISKIEKWFEVKDDAGT